MEFMYTQVNLQVGFWQRRTAIDFEVVSIAQLKSKLSYFDVGCASSNSRRLLAKTPTFEFIWVYPSGYSLSQASAKECESCKEEVIFLKENMQVVAEDCQLCPIALPAYLGIRGSAENTRLLSDYKAMRAEITKILFEEDFLERVLFQLFAT